MEITLALQLIVLFVLLGLSAFFSSSETSLFSLSAAQRQQMQRDRNPRLKLIEQLLSEPRRLIATILIGNEFVNVCASVLSATIVITLLGPEKSWLNIVIMVPVLLLFGEITPKTFAFKNNVAFATFQSRYIEMFAWFISPLRNVVRAVSEFFINLIVSGEHSQSNILTEDMVRSLTNAAVGEGSLNDKESQYIHHIFDFGNKKVSDVMTYRSQMVEIDESMHITDIVNVVRTSRSSRLALFAEDGETLIGIVFARDLLGLELSVNPVEEQKSLRDLARKPYLVPGSRMAADLFMKMRDRRTTLALVSDEFGGIIGMVTTDDLLECIFGDLPSENGSISTDAPILEVLGTGSYRASGGLPIRQFNSIAGTDLAKSGVITLAGLLLEVCGEIPGENDVVTIDNVTFTINKVSPQRILQVSAKVRAAGREDALEIDSVKSGEANDSPATPGVSGTEATGDEPVVDPDAGGEKP